ncbi:MAG: SDR family oxidoreductase [Thermoplasmata archaeon]|nr:SDR family oxidoreductase [Thermoplasmata archaeon]
MVKMSSFKGKVALITGGSSGIGLEAAGKLHSRGADILIAARDEEKLKGAVSTIGERTSWYAVDVSDWEAVSSLSEKITRERGKIDILINSAGMVHPSELSVMDPVIMKRTVDVDLMGTMNMCRAFLGSMRRPGYIVNISSMAGFLGLYGYTAYSAAKFGVWGFSEALRMELEPDGIGVSVVFPPDTDTPQLEYENAHKPRELKEIGDTIRPISPGHVADAIIRGMEKGAFMVHPTSSGGMTFLAKRMMPTLLSNFLDGKVKSARGSKR